MAVLIKQIGTENDLPIFEVTDLATNEVVLVKNWFEKKCNKYHIVLGTNSANRKYVAHNEFKAKATPEGTLIVEDKTSGPRKLGTAQPDAKLMPYMTEDDKIEYDAIIARAKTNREAQVNIELTEEEKLERQIAKIEARLAAKRAADAIDVTNDDEVVYTNNKKKHK